LITFNSNNSSYGVTSEVTTDQSLPAEPFRIWYGEGLYLS